MASLRNGGGAGGRSSSAARERVQAQVCPVAGPRPGGAAPADAALGRQIADAVVQYPLPSHWETLTASGGDSYYWNRVTDETTWEHPLTGAAGEVLEALRDCRNASGNSVGAAATEARKRRLASWHERWHQGACGELQSWRSVASQAGASTYFYRISKGEALAAAISTAETTWEDPRAKLELRIRFQSETLASLLGLPVPEVPPAASAPTASAPARGSATGAPAAGRNPPAPGGAVAPATRSRGRAGDQAFGKSPSRSPERVRRRRAADGQWFRVEALPADHSCGFHGLEIRREEAAELLHRHRGDAEVQAFVVADFFSLMLTGERKTMPPEIRNEEKLWSAMDAYYGAQQGLDEKRREARELLAEEGGVVVADCAIEAAGGSVPEAVQQLFADLKAAASSLPSGAEKLQVMQRLGRCKMHAKALTASTAALQEAEKALRRQCQSKADAYVNWVGSDMSFWLSFVRGCGGDRGGGLLDALAKVRGLTVRIWAEQDFSLNHAALPDLELVHVASFGGREIDLWFQGNRGHFDRLVPCDSG